MQLSANQKSKKIQSYKLREAHVMSKQSFPLSESFDSSSRPGAPAMPFQSLEYSCVGWLGVESEELER